MPSKVGIVAATAKDPVKARVRRRIGYYAAR